VKREVEQPTTNERGDEIHPAYGLIGAHRVTSNPGAVLFDSEITHNDVVLIRLYQASRKRDLNRNWIHETGRRPLFEVAMSEAQWASFVSSMNVGSGVPCTIESTQKEMVIPGLPFKPVLGESLAEVRNAAQHTFAEIKAARDAYEAAIARKAPAKEIKELRRTLYYAIENATANIEYVGKSLNEHAENTVQKARADIEAMVLRATEQADHQLEAAPATHRPIGRTPHPRVIDALPTGESDQ
jgi:hypothetical protein